MYDALYEASRDMGLGLRDAGYYAIDGLRFNGAGRVRSANSGRIGAGVTGRGRASVIDIRCQDAAITVL